MNIKHFNIVLSIILLNNITYGETLTNDNLTDINNCENDCQENYKNVHHETNDEESKESAEGGKISDEKQNKDLVSNSLLTEDISDKSSEVVNEDNIENNDIIKSVKSTEIKNEELKPASSNLKIPANIIKKVDDSILKLISNKISSIKQASVSLKKIDHISNVELLGFGYYKNKKIRIEFIEPIYYLIIINAKSIMKYDPYKSYKAEFYSNLENIFSLLQNPSLANLKKEKNIYRTEALDDSYVITLLSTTDNNSICEVYLNKKTLDIEKILNYNQKGDIEDSFIFGTIQYDANLSDEIFDPTKYSLV